MLVVDAIAVNCWLIIRVFNKLH